MPWTLIFLTANKITFLAIKKAILIVSKPSLFFLIMYFLCPALYAEENAPETDIKISAEQYTAMLGHVDFAYSDDVTVSLPAYLLSGASQVSLQVQWADTCSPVNGSTGLNIKVKGFRNEDEQADSLELSNTSLFFTTKLWLSVTQSGQSMSTTQQYECDVKGTEYWPVSISNATVSKLILTFEIARPTCSISTLKAVKLPPVSKFSPSSSAELPISVDCSNFTSSPTVFLTLNGGQASDDGSLYEDSNISIEAISDETGQRWKADGIEKYPVGQVDTVTKITPLIRSSIKEGANAGSYEATATITLGVE